MADLSISLRRLQRYELECRRHAAGAVDEATRVEFAKLAETIRRRIREIQGEMDAVPIPLGESVFVTGREPFDRTDSNQPLADWGSGQIGDSDKRAQDQ